MKGLSPMARTSLDPSNTILKDLDVFLMLEDQFPESFVEWSLPESLSVLSELPPLAIQAPPEGVKEVIILVLPPPAFSILRPPFLPKDEYFPLVLGCILSLTPKMLPSSSLFLILRPTPVVTGGHLAAGVLVVGSPLSGFTDSP